MLSPTFRRGRNDCGPRFPDFQRSGLIPMVPRSPSMIPVCRDSNRCYSGISVTYRYMFSLVKPDRGRIVEAGEHHISKGIGVILQFQQFETTNLKPFVILSSQNVLGLRVSRSRFCHFKVKNYCNL